MVTSWNRPKLRLVVVVAAVVRRSSPKVLATV
jgi:hypothetical protein